MAATALRTNPFTKSINGKRHKLGRRIPRGIRQKVPRSSEWRCPWRSLSCKVSRVHGSNLGGLDGCLDALSEEVLARGQPDDLRSSCVPQPAAIPLTLAPPKTKKTKKDLN